MKSIIISLTIILAFTGGFLLGYQGMAPAVETRVITDANMALLRCGVRKYELALDEGTVFVIPRRK